MRVPLRSVEEPRDIDDFGFHGLPTSPERAEEVFLRDHPELEEPTGRDAFESLDQARDFVLDVCASLVGNDGRAAGRLLPERVMKSDDVMSKGAYKPETREMWLRLLVKFSALHEIAHWLVPADSERMQHFKPWRDAQVVLVAQFLDQSYATQLENAYAAAEYEAPGGVFECDRPLFN